MMIVCCSSNSVERVDATYSVMELVDLEIFLASKNLTLSDSFKKLNIIQRKILRRFRWFKHDWFTKEEVLKVGVGLCLYGYAINCAREEAVLFHILHAHKKLKF